VTHQKYYKIEISQNKGVVFIRYNV